MRRISQRQWIVGQLPTRAMCEYGAAWNKDPNMPFSDRQGLDSLSRMPFIDTAELAGSPRRGLTPRFTEP